VTRASFDDLASVALLGTRRRPVPAAALPEPLARAAQQVAAGSGAPAGATPDGARHLLDVAALAAVYRRAGLRCGPARALPPPAPPDRLRPAPPAAAARLDELLGGSDRDLLQLWLVTAAARGLRPPHRALPALLDAAVRAPALAGAVLAATGPRGRWLAERRPEWRPCLAALPAGSPPWDPPAGDPSEAETGNEPAGGWPDVGRAADDVWRTGTAGRRRAWLEGARRADPAAARSLLEAGWAREAPVDRATLLDALAVGLGGDDEAFLEGCLDDRRGDVRGVAVRLLALVPGSAYRRRAAARGATALQRERHVLRRRIAVTVPAERDAAMGRDQVPAPPAQAGRGTSGGRGPGAWLLTEVVAAAPLDTWTPALGATPGEVTGLDVADGWQPAVWLGWARAAVREGDVAWARALLATVPRPQPAARGGSPFAVDPADPSGPAAALLQVLPPPERAEQVAALLRERAGVTPVDLLRALPGPWDPPVPGAVLAWLAARPRLDDVEGRALLDLAARRLPVQRVDALRDLADRWPPQSPSRRVAAVAAELMTIRRAILEELQ